MRNLRAACEVSQGLAGHGDARRQADMQDKTHLQSVFAMRRVDQRFSQLSAMTCEPGCRMPGRCLHVRIDGLDQANGPLVEQIAPRERQADLEPGHA